MANCAPQYAPLAWPDNDRSPAPLLREIPAIATTLEPVFVSTAVVALAEMGDKTQLLAFALAARFRRKLPIVCGILVATLANHLLAGVVGTWLTQWLSPVALKWIVAASFFVFALWALKPDRLENADAARTVGGVFVTTTATFFVVEMGDKTQLATVALAARFAEQPFALVSVVLGTTLGMMIANVPAVWLGDRLAARIDMTWMRRLAAALFAVLGVATLFF